MAKRGRIDAALADVNEAIALKRDDKDSFLLRSELYVKLGENDKAIADLDQVILFDPKNAWAFANRGLALAKKSEYRKAIADLEKAIEIGGENTDWLTYGVLAFAYAEDGQFEKAVVEQKNALAHKSFDEQNRPEMERHLKLFEQHKPVRSE